MSIFLTGGGDQENFTELDKYFISQLEAPAKLLLIPHACDQDEYDDILERLEDVFLGKFVKQIDLLEDPNAMSFDVLEQYQGLIFEGGNTFQLVNSIRESQFFSLLKKYSQLERPIYADSAGAILLGSDVHSAFLGEEADQDHIRLQDYRGLDLIPPWSIHAHYEPEDYDQLEQLLYDQANPIIALPEAGGVYISGNNIISMGSEPIELITFSGREVLNPQEKFSLI